MMKEVDKEDTIKEIKRFVEKREEIKFAYIFGSFIEDEGFNDIDLAIYIDSDDTLTKELFYEIGLSNKLEEIIKLPVDVIVLNNTSSFVSHRASQGKLIKNVDDDMRINFITTRWKEYWDFKNKIHEHIEEIKAWQ
jgi:predicted nucleotidyltransferase